MAPKTNPVGAPPKFPLRQMRVGSVLSLLVATEEDARATRRELRNAASYEQGQKPGKRFVVRRTKTPNPDGSWTFAVYVKREE